MARARATLRSMIVRLGEAATIGLRDERDVIGPYVAAVLDARADLRAALTVGDLRHEVAQGRDEAQVENGGAQAVADAARLGS